MVCNFLCMPLILLSSKNSLSHPHALPCPMGSTRPLMADERKERSYWLPYIDPISRLNVSFKIASGSDVAESSASSQKRENVLHDDNSIHNAGSSTLHRYRDVAQNTTSYREYSTESIELGVAEDADSQSLSSDCSGRYIQKRSLGSMQMTSLMINSVIGSGIFTTPGYVLVLTKCKSIALSLWFVGGISTGLWFVIF